VIRRTCPADSEVAAFHVPLSPVVVGCVSCHIPRSACCHDAVHASRPRPGSMCRPAPGGDGWHELPPRSACGRVAALTAAMAGAAERWSSCATTRFAICRASGRKTPLLRRSRPVTERGALRHGGGWRDPHHPRAARHADHRPGRPRTAIWRDAGGELLAAGQQATVGARRLAAARATSASPPRTRQAPRFAEARPSRRGRPGSSSGCGCLPTSGWWGLPQRRQVLAALAADTRGPEGSRAIPSPHSRLCSACWRGEERQLIVRRHPGP